MQSLQAPDSFYFVVQLLASQQQMLVSVRHAYVFLGLLLATIKAINLMKLVGLKVFDA